MKALLIIPFLAIQMLQETIAQKFAKSTSPVIKIVNGMVKGTHEPSGVNSFKGIPFAAPPVAELRWKEPQPVKNWRGTLDATQFGPNGMQTNVFGDMAFRSRGMNEDCLYLNVWQ